MCARSASCSTVISSSRWRPIHWTTSPTVSQDVRGSGRWMYCACPPSRWGGTTMRRAMALAVSAPCSWRTTCRQASMPEAVPAEVITAPSST